MIEKLKKAVEYIQSVKEVVPKVGMVLGSGLGIYVDKIEEKTFIPYSDIPFFHGTAVEGHEGRLILGKVDGVDIVALQGRIHAYEGHDMEDIVFATRVLASLGIESLILTNAAGGINEDYKPGDLVLIKDHINLMGRNPLVGPNYAELGPRFPDMTYAYNLELRKILQESAKEINMNLRQGIYCGLLGPTYETPAEINMLRIIGADMVGMSTVPEAIAANHLGIKVAGISCITNMAAGITKNKLNHDEVKEQALMVMESFAELLSKSIKKIGALSK